jgi:predicted TIM-barrel fold metal-dependent hydrolase
VIIDAHAHVWPDHIAPRMVAAKPVGLTPVGDGTVSGLLRTMDAAGIDMACALGIANAARTLPRTNEFIGSVDRSRLIPFGTVHPDLSDEQNLASLSDNGIRAVKLHPLFQELSLTDPRVVDLMRAIAGQGIVVLTHAGAGGDEAATKRGSPANVVALARAVPGLTLIACHFGGYHLLDEAEREVAGSRVIIETSWPPSARALDAGRIRRVIERHGADRVVFGSDWPMAKPAAEIAAVRSWGLANADISAILGENLARLVHAYR